MNRRRALFVVIVSVAVSGFVACAAPYRTVDLDFDSDAGSADGSTDAAGDSSIADQASPPDAQAPLDSSAPGDAQVALDATPSCDQDHDGYLAERDGCGGTDCDDLDPRTNPDAGFVNTPPREGGTDGDFNCDGTVTREYATDLVCTGMALNCHANVGYIGSPACGEAAVLNECVVSGLDCVFQAQVSTAQGCR